MSEIVKTCRKHGGLQIDDTYLMKTKVGNLIRMCILCKRGYRNDWAKLNPEKVKISQIKKRIKRIKELDEGILSKNCKRHGSIPIDKIRIDTRGTHVCKLCDAENGKKFRDSHKETRSKKCKEWRIKNPDKMKKCAINYKPRRKETTAALRKRWMADPVQREKIHNWQRKSGKKAIEDLSDAYIKGLVRSYRTGGKKNRFYLYMKVDVPQEIIEIKRAQVKLNRAIKRKRKNGD